MQLWLGQGDNPQLKVVLREDRSKEGRVIVHFSADRTQLDHIRLMVMAPCTDGALGCAQYRLQIKDFVEVN